MNPSDPASAVNTAKQTSRQSILAGLRETWGRLDAGQRGRWRGALLFWGLLLLLFAKPLVSLFAYTSGKELHSHIALIPLVSIYLLCINRNQLPGQLQTSPVWGGVFALAGAGCLGLAWYLPAAGFNVSNNDSHVLPVLSFLAFLAAGGFFFLGRKWMAAAAYPAAFLLFMVPLPDGAVHFLESASQRASAETASWFYKIAGVPHLRSEEHWNLFDLPGIQLKVAQECSGIRSSWVLLITSVVAAHMFLKSPWRRAVFVFLVIPLGLLRNGFRILVIGWLCVEKGPHMIDHWIHHRGGPVFFVLSLIPLFLILWLLRRGDTRPAQVSPPSSPSTQPALTP